MWEMIRFSHWYTIMLVYNANGILAILSLKSNLSFITSGGACLYINRQGSGGGEVVMIVWRLWLHGEATQLVYKQTNTRKGD